MTTATVLMFLDFILRFYGATLAMEVNRFEDLAIRCVKAGAALFFTPVALYYAIRYTNWR